MLAQPAPPPPRRAFISSLMAGILASTGLGTRQAVAAAPEAIRQPDRPAPEAFVARAFEMRRQAVESGDQAYGAVVVRSGRIVGQSPSRVVLDGDPTAHAEMAAIRDAARRLGSRDLDDSVLYSSSRACPMCEAAAYWAGIERLVYGSEGRDGGVPTLCG
ncbi:MAG: nucleoside deaminase [Alphaproteobacteria bacterium]|nr:nucleoside deaminase [Alphaproteobacteria bacterium]